MFSIPSSKVWPIVSALALLVLVSFSFTPRSLPIVLGDYQTSNQPELSYPLLPTAQATGVNPTEGPPGSKFSVSGSGFRSFTKVESITLGGVEILNIQTAATDANGVFQVNDLIVPGFDPGITNLIVKVGSGQQESTVVGTFTVTELTESPDGATSVSTALAPLSDSLERVFHFDNATKVWHFFDPRPVFANANDLTEIIEGEVYWIKVTQSVTVTLNAKQQDLTCSNEGTPQQDCWNLVVW